MDIFIFILAAVLAEGHASSQDMVDYLSANLQVQYRIISNMESSIEDGGPRSKVNLELTNIGADDVKDTNWEIYLCSIRLWEPDVLKKQVGKGKALGESGIMVYHVQGSLHKLTAGPDFRGFLSDLTLNVPFQTSSWQAAKTDVSPNWYITAPGAEPRTLFYTAGEKLSFVGDLNTPEQWKRRDYDAYNPYQPRDRYALSTDTDTDRSNLVIPTPFSVKVISQKTLNIHTGDWIIVTSMDSIMAVAKYLGDTISMSIKSESAGLPDSRYIYLKIGDILEEEVAGVVDSDEAYHLTASAKDEVVTITGRDLAGVMYGVQTLISMQDGYPTLPEVSIVDYPRFEYRGMHVDVSRHFHSKKALMKLMDAMVMYKLNKLHLHLSDDEGWRLHIPGLDELTEVGGKRCHDLEERKCILPQGGSGPVSGDSGSGFYTVEDYRELLKYANERFIEVIPEFDMPGHAHAAIKAMEARYHRLKLVEPQAASEYLLSDPDDRSEYVSIQSFRDNAVNPCLQSTYNFITKLVTEVKAMHADIQPLGVFHFGGDEVAKGAWEKSPACGKHASSDDLKKTFVEQASRIVSGMGLKLGGWEDGVMWNSTQPYDISKLGGDVMVNAWNNIWEWGGGSKAYILANNGYQVVLSHATDLYFDHPYEPDPEERGLYWASRYTETRHVYNYMPSNIYGNIEVDLWGKPLEKENVCRSMGCVQLEEHAKKNIKGIQGQLWSETVKTEEQLDSMIFPRLLALAERAWHHAPWETVEDDQMRKGIRDMEWGSFAYTIGHKELIRLDKMGISYNIPLPGAVVGADGVLHARTHFPGLLIQFSVDGSASWVDYTQPITFPHDTVLHLRTRSADMRRSSRTIVVHTPRVRSEIPSAAVPVFYDSIILISSLFYIWLLSK